MELLETIRDLEQTIELVQVFKTSTKKKISPKILKDTLIIRKIWTLEFTSSDGCACAFSNVCSLLLILYI